MKEAEFEKTWGITTRVDRRLVRECVRRELVKWNEAWLSKANDALAKLPRGLIGHAKLRSMIVAGSLEVPIQGDAGFELVAADAAYLEVDLEKVAAHLRRAIGHVNWVALDHALFHDPPVEPYLKQPLLPVLLCEEVAHAWDFALQRLENPWCSNPRIVESKWRHLASSLKKKPRRFDIPNRKEYDLDVEDWASTVVWHVFAPERLKRRAPDHHEFATRLFEHFEIDREGGS